MAGEVPLELGLPLPPLDGVADVSPEEVLREGGSRPYRVVLAANGSEYYCKGPTLYHNVGEHPYVGANEWIAAGLARAMNVPVRSFEIISFGGHLMFGSETLKRKMTGPLSQNWDRLDNAPAVAYDLVALDCWTMNTDRHDQNYLAMVVSADRGRFLASDHDLAVLSQGTTPQQLVGMVDTPIGPRFVSSNVIRSAITDAEALSAAIGRAEAVPDRAIATIVGRVPPDWLDVEGQRLVLEFLLRRRAALRSLFRQGAATFPNLIGAIP